jgi:hypothetical protein
MDAGTGIAAATAILGFCGVGITAIVTRKNGKRDWKEPYPPCPEHSGVCEVLKNLDRKIDRIIDHLNILG